MFVLNSRVQNITDQNFTQWTDITYCQSTVPVVHRYTGGPSFLQQRHTTSIKTLPLLVC